MFEIDHGPWARGAALLRALLVCAGTALSACSSPSPPGGVSGQAKELLGIWVSNDDPAETLVFEFLTHDPYSDLLAGKSQVYRMWQYPPGSDPVTTQLGAYDVVGDELRTTPIWSTAVAANQTYVNAILSRAGDTLVLSSSKLASGRRTLARVTAFPGGSFGGGVATPAEPVQPQTRTLLYEYGVDAKDRRGALFRVGAAEAHAAIAVSARLQAWEDTFLSTFRTQDSGGSWGEQLKAINYAGSRVRMKEQAHGRPLVYPINTLSAYLYLWEPELGAWDRDNAVQICAENAKFPDRDVVLRSAKGIAYTACIADKTIAVHRRVLSLNSNRVASITGTFDRVLAQWLKGSTEHGTLFVLGLTRGAAKPLALYTYVETHETEFAGFGSPASEIAADCGGIACQVADLWRYFITGDGVHHIVALAESEKLPTPAHPLAPQSRLALHLHGTPGGAWKTEVLNLREGAFLGNLVDLDFPQGHPGEPERLRATLQDDACLRVLSSPSASIAWKLLGVVPTLERPLEESALVWSDETIGLVTRGTKHDYISLPVLSDPARCPAPRAAP